MAKKTDPDDVTLYDLDPKFQDRLLKWLTKNASSIEINVEPDGMFHVEGGSSSNQKLLANLEEALNGVMHSRAELGLLDVEFQGRVRDFLSEHSATILVMAVNTSDGPGFQVAVLSKDAEGKDIDIDFEIALVLAEEKFMSAIPRHRLPPEERAALEQALVSPAQREDELEERHERLRRSLMEPRAELLENRQSVSYRVWCGEVDESLATVGARRQDSEYWRRLYLAGFTPAAAIDEFGAGAPDRAPWLRAGPPPPRRKMPTDPVELAYLENTRAESYADQARKYKYFIAVGDELVSGWEYREDATEALAELSPAEGRASARIVPKSKLTARELDEFAQRNQYTRNHGKLIRISYEIVTPESAEEGDAEERGWVDEEGIEIDDMADAVKLITSQVDSPEASSSHFHGGVWYSGLYNQDFRTGADEYRAFHLYGFTEPEERELFGLLTGYRRNDGEAPRRRLPSPPPRRGVMTSRAAQERALPRLHRMAYEDDKPFDPEAPREHYASRHHFAVNTRR